MPPLFASAVVSRILANLWEHGHRSYAILGLKGDGYRLRDKDWGSPPPRN